MKILVAGATGAIGQPLIQALLQAGHQVLGITRSAHKAAALAQAGAIPAQVDIFDAAAVLAIYQRWQPDVVVDLLTALPKRYSPEAMAAAVALDHQTRREGDAHLLAAAQARIAIASGSVELRFPKSG